MPKSCVDLIVADPPYGLGKDYGNNSDKLDAEDYLAWTTQWVDLALPRLKPAGSLYIFLTWRNSPEIFCMLKKRMLMLNEIVWDRRVPSMGGGTRRFSSVHDTIGFFALSKDYYFDIGVKKYSLLHVELYVLPTQLVADNHTLYPHQ